jgi:pilus assembly protein CpaB
MNKRFIAVLVFAFVVASGASLLLYRLMSGRQQTAKAAPAAIKIVLAAKNLEVGTLLKETDLKLADWSGTVPPGAALRLQDVVGRGVVSQIYPEEPVLESRLAAKGAGGGLAAMIPNGMRAVAVRVNEVVGVAGFVVAGMRVDVLIAGSVPGATAQVAQLGTLTKTLLQNIEVLSAGQDFKKDAEGKPILVQVVNLLVTPEQAEQLSLASAQTQIQLVLRNPLDREIVKTPGTAMQHLFTGGRMNPQAPLASASAARDPEAPRAAPRPAPRQREFPPLVPVARPEAKPFVMEIINGNKRNETKFSSSAAQER